jgi:hypothetical protein
MLEIIFPGQEQGPEHLHRVGGLPVNQKAPQPHHGRSALHTVEGAGRGGPRPAPSLGLDRPPPMNRNLDKVSSRLRKLASLYFRTGLV